MFVPPLQLTEVGVPLLDLLLLNEGVLHLELSVAFVV